MIRIGIAGYGNLGKGVESAVAENPDMQLVGIFTRRDPQTVSARTSGAGVYSLEKAVEMKEEIDVMIICGGSAADLPELTPMLAAHFHVIDSFDTHADIERHFARVDSAARASGKSAVISAGWDPGMFSLNRLYAACILPNGKDYTFWGKGISQGHSDAIRHIPGVIDARQYTIPRVEALKRVRRGEHPALTAGELHRRECFVAAEEGADRKAIRETIRSMPNYFSGYDTIVHFIPLEQLLREHGRLPHGGSVIRSGVTGWEGERQRQTIEYRLSLESNPDFTGSILAACARAVYRFAQRGEHGCRTLFDIAPAELSLFSAVQLRRSFL